jgi:hypothetical protein
MSACRSSSTLNLFIGLRDPYFGVNYALQTLEISHSYNDREHMKSTIDPDEDGSKQEQTRISSAEASSSYCRIHHACPLGSSHSFR